MISAQEKIKALAVSRLMMGVFDEWSSFEKERDFAAKIVNRRFARSATSQTYGSYSKLKNEINRFMNGNFLNCTERDLSILCDAITVGQGLHMRLDHFERDFFKINEKVKGRFPLHASVVVSIFGLQFEYPEHHFINDLKIILGKIEKSEEDHESFLNKIQNHKSNRDRLGEIISERKFLQRSIISSSFNLIESFLSGLFYAAKESGKIYDFECSDEFIDYAINKESDSLKNRIEKIISFLSGEKGILDTEPFIYLMGRGKLARDSIHHTSPFPRKGIDEWGRINSLYGIDIKQSLSSSLYSASYILKMFEMMRIEAEKTIIGAECSHVVQRSLNIIEKIRSREHPVIR